MIRILSDQGTEYCGRPELHDDRLYLALNDIEHTKTKVRHSQTNGLRTLSQAHPAKVLQIAFRHKIYSQIEYLQADLDS